MEQRGRVQRAPPPVLDSNARDLVPNVCRHNASSPVPCLYPVPPFLTALQDAMMTEPVVSEVDKIENEYELGMERIPRPEDLVQRYVQRDVM